MPTIARLVHWIGTLAIPSIAMSDDKTPPTEAPSLVVDAGPLVRPPGWKYKAIKIGGVELWYASPKVQLFMVAMVCFLCPGMYNAITGMGAGGQVNAHAQDKASVALYSVFSVVGFFSGTFANRLGLRPTLAIGGIGYCIYASSFLCYSHTSNSGFVIFSGALLGLCAGLLWTAQGTIMMAYPPERQKGRYISVFWIIFNLGAVIGALIPLGQNIHATTAKPVTDGTYAGFIVLMFLGALLALTLCDANDVIREDGTKVILMKNPSWKSELIGLKDTLTQDPLVVLLFPMMFASNIFYTYQTNDMNAAFFNTRTRSLNNVLYWGSQIFGAIIFGHALDYARIRRSIRARVSFCILFALTFAIWGGGYAWEEKQLSRSLATTENPNYAPIDWTAGGNKYIGPMFLYMFYGFYDACWQTCIYWYMGALSNSGRKAANLAGFYKGIQSAGAAIFWRLDDNGVAFNKIYGATWGILAGSLLIAAPLIVARIRDTVSIDEDLKFSDETIEDIVVPAALHEKGETGV
ncbi:duf895 domain protein membrane protein [Grosmannia clavigera kw1407]|uniref:Duf895 domain protein membrane protein n=1 Tax=Grosmannia clavigera (strain kw1407 / UAMH 11150) TaxID=655863 RepID=F0X7N5_GROCL|nr:duf895 domain protein membrane protein [Grosmannia clavigera kw1407]EFX06224.1 duf895 domain protein membrane protein [Grosmannia clavigera kw1407]